MKQTIWLLALLAFFSLPMNAQNNYSKLWTKVQKAQKAGKPQTAAGYLRELEKQTVSDKDELEQLAVSEALYGELQKYNWKEANAYYPSYSSLRRRVMNEQLDENIVKYRNHPRVMMLLYRKLLDDKAAVDRKYNPAGQDYLELRERCRVLLGHRYVGEYKKDIQGIIDGMESQSLSSSSYATLASPAVGVEYTLHSRNVGKVDVSVYRLYDNRIYIPGHDDDSESTVRRNASLVSSHVVEGFRNEFNIRESMKTKLDFPEPGVYLVRFSSGEEVCTDQVYVSRVGGAVRVREGRAEVYAADVVTGKPYGSGTMSVYRNPGRNSKSSILRLSRNSSSVFSGEGFTVADVGRALEERDDRRDEWWVRVENGSDIYAQLIMLPYRNYYSGTKEERLMTSRERLFTDRKLYKPGDTVFFKILCFEASETVGKVSEGKELEVSIRHSSEKEALSKQALVTNEFGSAAGSFLIPEGSKNGVYNIETKRYRLGTVRVEEYKRPSFSISVDPVTNAYAYGDVVKQGGQLFNYSGFPLAGGEVRYRVSRASYNRTRGFYIGSEDVMEGTAVSGSDGRFEVSFQTSRPELKETPDDLVYSNYSIHVSATDPQGETHEQGLAVPVADVPVEISVFLPENERFGARLIVDKDRTGSVTVNGSVLNGSAYDGKGEWQLLDAENKQLRKGKFNTNQPVDFDFASLPSGDYRLRAEMDFRGRRIESFCDIVVLSTDDTRLPFKSTYFYYPVVTEGAIEFLIGTTEDDLYLELELFDNDRQLYREGVHLKNELRKFRLPYKDEYRSAVKLSVFGFRNGEEIDRSYEFRRPGDVRLDVAVETFRDKTGPNTEESMRLKAPAGSELLVSIYDITTDRYGANSFNYVPLREYAYVSRPAISSSLEGPGLYFAGYRNKAVGMADMAMSAKVAVEAMSSADEDSHDAAAGREDAEEAAPEMELRSNFKELIAFYPQIKADESGITTIKYTSSDMLGTFRTLVFAHDKKLHTGSAEAAFVVQKELIVQPNVPLFVTEGDCIVLKAKLVNLGDTELRGTAYAEIKDASGKKLRLKGLESKKRSLLSGAQDEVSWTVTVPGGTDRLDVRIWFSSPRLSDGEEHSVKVVPNTITLTEAASFVMGGPRGHKYYEQELRRKFSATNPIIEYAEYSTLDAVRQSLPKAEEPGSRNSIEWINQLYINQMRQYVLKDESEEYALFRKKAFAQISRLQGSDGGIQWFPGMNSNSTLTLYFLEKLGQMRSLGAFIPEDDEMKVIRRALGYVDSGIESQGSRKDFRPFGLIRDFAVRSLWYDVTSMDKNTKSVYERFVEQTREGWQNISILEKAQLVNLMLRAGGSIYDKKEFTDRIRLLRESLMDYAVENPTIGCYFPNAVMPFRGLMNSEIYAHAQLIETFGRLGEKKMVDGIAQWLLLQKHNQAWENTVATTDAVHALLSSNARDLKLGAVYYTYTEKLERVQASSNEIKIERSFIKASTGETIEEGDRLRVGDEIIVRYHIHNTENRSFVQMRAMRPASFYPRDERSYFTWYGFYREVKPGETNYYWELLPEEYIDVEERFFVQQEGSFNSGLVEIECLYAREYRGHTGAQTVVSK